MASAIKFAPNTPIYHDQFVAQVNQRLWWLLLGAALIITGLIATFCIIELRPHSRPWVIGVDAKGQPRENVIPLEGSAAIADNTIRWAIGEYVQNAFSISPDFDEEKIRLANAYAMSDIKAGDVLTAYYQDNKGINNPLKNNYKSWQEVRVIDTLKLPAKDDYQVDYTILKYDQQHKFDPTATHWKATMEVVQGPPSDRNPLGLWVKYINFGKEAQ